MEVPLVMLPKAQIFALGGTIAMSASGDGPGVRPELTAEALVESVPELSACARIEASSFRQVPGAHLSFDDLIALAAAIDECSADGCDGVVITQGTDTIEETAFALDRLVNGAIPVVVTGAMRNPDLPGADGPANLLAAVRVAASREARGAGVLVVLNDEIHAARLVQKRHTTNPAAFMSPLSGPIGWVVEKRVRIIVRPGAGPKFPDLSERPEVPVALLPVSLGDDGRLLDSLPSLGYGGLVLEGFGVGHVPADMVPRIDSIARRIPTVLASRIGVGETARETYGFVGSEIDLLGRGLIPAGMLDGPKARVLLTLLLRAGASRAEIVAAFESFMEPLS